MVASRVQFFEGEEMIFRQERLRLWHAVSAADVAPISHTQPQVVMASPKLVDQWCPRRLGCPHVFVRLAKLLLSRWARVS